MVVAVSALVVAGAGVAVTIGPLRTTSAPAAAASPGASVLPGVFLVDAGPLAAERSLYRSGDPGVSALVTPLLRRADRDLTVTPPSVTTKKQVPPNGDRRYYLSTSIYAWPDPKKPNGLPWTIRDGDRNPTSDAIPDKDNLVDMINWSHELAYAYYFSGDQAYAAKASTILHTWFLDTATKMAPTMEFAQGLPGKSNGQPGGIIDAADLPEVVDAVQLLAGSTSWSASDTARMKSWFSSYLTWLTTTSNGKAEAATSNNHATWYDDQVISYALFTGDTSLAKSTVVKAESKIIGAQITSGGSQPKELARTDSWSYSTYNLDALTRLAQLAANVKIDLWTYTAPSGGSIRNALNFVLNRQTHWTYPQGRAATAQYLVEPLYAAAAAYQSGTYAADATKAAAGLQAAYPVLALLYPAA